MEGYVEEYLDDIRNYNEKPGKDGKPSIPGRPTLALYAASRLADACIAGRVEDWRDVRSTVWLIPNPWRLWENRAVCLFENKLWNYTPAALDAARERYLFTEGFRKMYGHALFEYREQFATGELQPDTYWHNTDGDLSAADIEAEEKFE